MQYQSLDFSQYRLYLLICMHRRSCHVTLWRWIFWSYGHTASSIKSSWQLGRCKAAGTQEIVSVAPLPMGLNQPADQRITHRSNYYTPIKLFRIGLAFSICRLLKLIFDFIFCPQINLLSAYIFFCRRFGRVLLTMQLYLELLVIMPCLDYWLPLIPS